MEGWIQGTNYWFSKDENQKHVCSSIEPAGLVFSGLMNDDEWNTWSNKLKRTASEILGYKIGEIELGEVGHDFIWINPRLKVFEEFRTIYNSKDDQKAWDFFELDTSELTELEEIEIEKKMFRLDWHNLHASLASNFQARKHPSTALFLYNSVINGEIPEFDYKPVSRRCIWTLADIGTVEAKEYLKKISKLSDKILAGYAVKRLINWEKEKDRKGRK